MKEKRAYNSPLRQQQTEETRQRIVEAALELVAEQKDGVFSHEEIAKKTNIAARTVYRHFPAGSDLLDAVWQESDRRLNLKHYPDTEESLLAGLETMYSEMDKNAALIRGLLNTNAGREMRKRDNERRRQGIAKALANATAHLGEVERKRANGIFQILFSGRAWEMLRDRALLGPGDSAKAVEWAMRSLLDSLYREQAKAKRTEAKSDKGKKR